MTFWALHLHENFPQAVELVLSMENTVSFENSRLLFGIDEEALGKIYPDATADLVVLYLKQAQQPFYQGDALRNVWKALHENGASEDRLQRIRQEMYRLGFDPQE